MSNFDVDLGIGMEKVWYMKYPTCWLLEPVIASLTIFLIQVGYVVRSWQWSSDRAKNIVEKERSSPWSPTEYKTTIKGELISMNPYRVQDLIKGKFISMVTFHNSKENTVVLLRGAFP